MIYALMNWVIVGLVDDLAPVLHQAISKAKS